LGTGLMYYGLGPRTAPALCFILRLDSRGCYWLSLGDGTIAEQSKRLLQRQNWWSKPTRFWFPVLT